MSKFIVYFSTVIFLIILFAYLEYFSLDFFKTTYIHVEDLVQKNYNYYLLLFFFCYFFIAALSLPFAAAFSIFIGAIFSFLDALLLIALASSLGASVCFLISKYTLKNLFEKKFATTLNKINTGLIKNGIFYLFFVRLVPIFPFFVINILFGLTNMSLKKFFIVSFLGMLPGIFLFVNAGRQISNINSIKDIYSINIILSFVLIGILPILLKKLMYYFNFIKE